MKEIIAKSLLSQKNSMNIYRGCTHGCIYCDSRSEIYGKTYDFENIEVKTNAVELLDKALSKKKEKSMIVTGAMTDPYLPIESTVMNTRKCLEIVLKHGFGIAVLTKSDLILRDLDLLTAIHKKSKCIVQMTLTTYDDHLCQIIEPNVCTTKRRLQVLKEISEAGIPTIVWLTPLLPFINDTEENLMALLEASKEADVKGILTFGMGMTLRYGNREYYYQKLDEHFPTLKKEYFRKYGASYGIKSPNSTKLTKIFRRFCVENNILYNEKEIFNYIWQFESKEQQLSLF